MSAELPLRKVGVIGLGLMGTAITERLLDAGFVPLVWNRSRDKAEPLYASLGYLTVGIVPAYSRDVFEDRFDDCTFMYKQLARKAQLSA